jgi:hypothetical protein
MPQHHVVVTAKDPHENLSCKCLRGLERSIVDDPRPMARDSCCRLSWGIEEMELFTQESGRGLGNR